MLGRGHGCCKFKLNTLSYFTSRPMGYTPRIVKGRDKVILVKAQLPRVRSKGFSRISELPSKNVESSYNDIAIEDMYWIPSIQWKDRYGYLYPASDDEDDLWDVVKKRTKLQFEHAD